MEGTEDKESQKGSKTNLNESNVPLLDDPEGPDRKGETPDNEKIELETKEDGGQPETKDTEEKGSEDKDAKKKKKKEKKPKSPKTHQRALSCANNLTIGLNLLDRDERHVNDHVNLVFEDVLAEPDSGHGFDNGWRLAYVIFSGTKYWVYRVLAAMVAVPCGLVWGLVFSLLTLLSIWVLTPVLRTLDVIFYVVRKVWSGLVRALLDPVFQSVGMILGNISVRRSVAREEVLKP